MTLPLAPYTVIDLTRARSGPTCVRQLADMGTFYVTFSGGEVLVRRDFFDILAHADTTPFTTIGLQTNGLLLRRLADQVNDSPITHVAVSLDAVEWNDRKSLELGGPRASPGHRGRLPGPGRRCARRRGRNRGEDRLHPAAQAHRR